MPLEALKMCKRILMEEPCGFQETCAYNLKKRYKYQNTEIKTLQEEFKKLKVELDTFKSNFKSVLSLRAEIEFMQTSIKYMVEEIQQLKTKNIDLEERIKHVEEEIDDMSDDESDSEVDLSPVKAKLTNANNLKQKRQEIKCDKWDFVGPTELFLNKHKNTKHPLQNIEEKSHIWETKHLSTDADSSTNAIGGWTKNSQKPDFFEKRKKNPPKRKNSEMSRNMTKLAIRPSTRGL